MFDRLNALVRLRAGDDRALSARRLRSRSFLAAAALLAAGLVAWAVMRAAGPELSTRIALLVPDAAPDASGLVAAWRDAAAEEGLALDVVRVSTFLRPRLARGAYGGLVLPDTVHTRASPALLRRVEAQVRAGAWLLLVYDAATRDPRGRWYPVAPLSALAGVEYGRYEALRDGTMRSGEALVTAAGARALRIPPGKTAATGRADGARALTAYAYGRLRYPSFVTRGAYGGKVLALAADGLGAGERAVGRGGVLFVNFPLGYLRGQSDGLLLRAALAHLGRDLLGLPALSGAPGGVGGLVFNVHVDSNGALAPLREAEAAGLLREGPFSVHFTAGPDTYREGDRAGLDLAHRAEAQALARELRARGDALGSHGGWIHNAFAERLDESNEAEMAPYLTRNVEAVEAAGGERCVEYSAPVGKQPLWVTRWLERHGFVAYYFTGDSGMAPTRSYREGRLDTPRIWAFPISTLRDVASFEEAGDAGLSEAEVGGWLVALTEFAADEGTIRTFYSHPPGWPRYLAAMRAWLDRARALRADGRFAFYTMTRVARFLDRRAQVRWEARREEGALRVTAAHPDDLSDMAWALPADTWGRPRVEAGSAAVRETPQGWVVAAGPGRTLRFTAPRAGAAP